jgi:hypothetical protein
VVARVEYFLIDRSSLHLNLKILVFSKKKIKVKLKKFSMLYLYLKKFFLNQVKDMQLLNITQNTVI